MTGIAVKSGLLTRGSPPPPPRQKPSHSVILTGIPTRTTANWAAAGSQHTATIPVIEAFNPYVNWPLVPPPEVRSYLRPGPRPSPTPPRSLRRPATLTAMYRICVRCCSTSVHSPACQPTPAHTH
eukprot:366230-Chlamydomonas_euryale.AAC.17